MKKIYKTLFVVFLPFLLVAQKEDNIWLFADESDPIHYHLDFTDNEINLIVDATYDTPIFAANTSISDSLGNLIFYTNGIKVINSFGEIVENGDSINCCGFLFESFFDTGYSASQNVIIFKSQLNNQKYYLVHYEIDFIPKLTVTKVFYSLVDMSLNNGHGKVIEKNVVLAENVEFDIMAANRHANGRDWWIVFPDRNENKFHRFLFTQDEFIGFDEQIIDEQTNDFVSGNHSFSSDGSRYVYSPNWNEIAILDFDRCTGEFSNEKRFSPFIVPAGRRYDYNGLGFSPNGRFLYTDYVFSEIMAPFNIDSIRSGIVQFDLWEDNFEDNGIELFSAGVTMTGRRFQPSPDGRLMFKGLRIFPENDFFSTINFPNRKGMAADVQRRFIELPDNNLSLLPYFPNYRLGPIDGSSCDTLGIDNLPLAGFRCEPDSNNNLQIIFTDNSFYEPTEWSWSFGDGEMSADTSPVHTFAELGIYEVCLTVSNDNASDTYCKILDMNPVGLEEIELEEGAFLVYPNPASDKITVKMPNKVLQGDQLHLYNNVGVLVKSITLAAEQTVLNVDIEQLPKGIYIVNYHSTVHSDKYTKVSILK